MSFFLGGWREATQKAYAPAHVKWIKFCESWQIDPDNPPVTEFANFFVNIFATTELRYTLLDHTRSALSAFLWDKKHITHGPEMTRLFKGFFNMRPPKPKLKKYIWDINVVLDHIRKLKPNNQLPLRLLQYKCLILIQLSTMCRKSVLLDLDLNHMLVKEHQITFSLTCPSKTFCATNMNMNQQLLTVTDLPGDPKICPLRCLLEVVDRTENYRPPGQTKLWILPNFPYTTPAASTIVNWCKTGLGMWGG